MQVKRSFGPFVFDQDHGLLSVEGRPAALSGRGALILETLLDAGGEIVTKSDLLQRAWPGTIVEEGNLAVQIATLRKRMATLSPDGREWILTAPRIGYRLLQPAGPIAQGASPASIRPAIAVLPFDNLSADPNQDYFADGIVEELTAALSRFKAFSVAARASAFALRGIKADIRVVADTLGVRYILDGSVRRAGEKVRIATHLVDASTGLDLWAERFEGDLADIFNVEDRITEAVVGLVEPQIRRAEIERARRKRPDDLGAYDLYLQALPYLYAAAPPNWTTALEVLGKAITLDPTFAPALAAAAWAHEKRIRQYMPQITADDTEEALTLARRAVAADPDDATVLAIAGFVPIVINSEFETGLALVRRALAMNPNNLTVLILAGFANVFAGDLDEAEASFFRGFQLSPGSPEAYLSLMGLAQVHLLTGEFEEAIQWGKHALAINDGYAPTIGNLAASYALAGHMDEARTMMAKLMLIKPVMTLTKMSARRIRDRLRWRNVIDGLRRAGMPEDSAGF